MEKKLIENLVGSVLGQLHQAVTREVRKVLESRILEYQVEEYNRNLFSKTLLFRESPKKLYDFYQPLFIRPSDSKDSDLRISTADIPGLFERYSCITLFGTGGSGKSTITKYVLIQCIEQEYRIPVKIELRVLNESEGDLNDFIFQNIFLQHDLAIDINHIKQLLRSGKFLFIFDGFDEVSSGLRGKVIRAINDFTQKFGLNKFLVTSRPYTKIELLPVYHNFSVCALDTNEIEPFIMKQVPEKRIAQNIIDGYKKLDHDAYNHYLTNPLLLSMFILSYQTFANIPTSKSKFYREVLNALFYLHDSMSKLNWERQMVAGLSKDEIESVVRVFSYVSFLNETYVFTLDYMNNVLNQIKSKAEKFKFKNEEFVEDISTGLCIMNQEGYYYMFPHRSLQEYFAALYISELNAINKSKAYSKLISKVYNNGFIDFFVNDNFFSLLLELDALGVVEHLAIPYLKQLNTLAKSPTNRQDKSTLMYGLYFFDSVITEKVEVNTNVGLRKALHTWSMERGRVILQARSEEGKRLAIMELSAEDQLRLDTIDDEALKVVKAQLPGLIRSFSEYLTNETSREGDIVDLV